MIAQAIDASPRPRDHRRSAASCRRGGVSRFVSALLSIASLTPAAPALAQDSPDRPGPLQIAADDNGVNLLTGKIAQPLPTLSVPAAPNLRFTHAAAAAPYIVKRTQAGEPDTRLTTISVNTADGGSDSFECYASSGCASVTGNGSIASIIGNSYTRGQSGEIYAFTSVHLDQGPTGPAPRMSQRYATSVSHASGETISYSYATATMSGDPLARRFHRPIKLTSNLGYHITLSYRGNDINADAGAWQAVGEAILYKASDPGTPLARYTYAANGEITDIAGRVVTCGGCTTALGAKIETATASLRRQGEASVSIRYVASPSNANLIGTVVRDGVSYDYAYRNARLYNASWVYDAVHVTGPNGYDKTYQISHTRGQNYLVSATEATGSGTRTTGYAGGIRPTVLTHPERNRVEVDYDDLGNVVARRAVAKPGSGLATTTELAFYARPSCGGALCFQPVWIRDARGAQTDLIHNAQGFMTERTDPADGGGVRRKTYVTYDTPAGLNRRKVVRVCGAGTTCGTASEIRTEYDYWENTFLPSVERRIDAATGTTLTTTFGYDPAGRQTVVDGPLPGNDDAVYTRYDVLGRKTWEIGAKGTTNYVRLAKRYTYRDSDDKVIAVESGRVAAPDSPALVVVEREDTTYDARRNPVRRAASSGGATLTVTDASFDDRGRAICTTVRMNPAAFAALPSDACTLGPAGAAGPDRITRDSYDAADQLLRVQKGVGTPLQQDYVTYTYTPNGRRASVKDANANLATMGYDGFDRQRSWNFPSKTAVGQASATDYEEYGYDVVGNRTSLRRRDGRTIAYAYDDMRRLVAKTYPQGGARSVHYAYDVRGLQTAARFDGPGGGDAVSSTWNGFGWQTSSTVAMAGVSRTLSYAYDAAGARTRVTFPDGQFASYNREATGEVYYADLNGGTFLFHPLEDTAGRRIALYRWSGGIWGIASSMGYDGIGRLTSLAHDMTGTGGDVTSEFGYDASGRIVSRVRDNDFYAFGGFVAADRAYAVNGLNQYTSAGPATFAYDANGNLIGDGTRSYGYDVENRLVSASGGVQLVWDPLGRLYQTSGGASGTTRFLYDGDALVGEYDAAGTMLARYVHGDDGRADEPLVWYAGAGTSSPRYLYADHQGSIVAVADAAGSPMAITGYDDYGIATNGANGATAPFGRFGYTGQAWLPDLGMYHYKARIYSPTLGRFLQTDPIGYDDQINLYAYVANDPINGRDPSGMRNCAPDDKNCIETPESAKDPSKPEPVPYDTAAKDDIVVTGQREKKNTSGNSEKFFEVTTTSLERRPLRQREVRCSNGTSVQVGRAAPLSPGSSAAHSHPGSFGRPGNIPGPGDNNYGSSSSTAYVMTPNRAYAIDRASNGSYRTRLLAGPGLGADEQANLVGNMQNWESGNSSNSSKSDSQRFCQ